MIVACPKCKTKYRVEEAKIPAEGMKLRCSKCTVIFLVRKPAAAPAKPTAPAPAKPAAPPAPAKSAALPVAARPPAPAAPPAAPAQLVGPLPPQTGQPKATILIADPEVSYLQELSDQIRNAGYAVYQAQDGNTALAAIKSKRPQVAIVDVALPGVFGFQISEQIKTDPALKTQTKIILIGSVYEKDRFRREPQSLYGADEYIEKHHDGPQIISKIQKLLTPPAKPAAPPTPARPPAPSAAPKPAAPPPSAKPAPAPAPAKPAAPPAPVKPAPAPAPAKPAAPPTPAPAKPPSPAAVSKPAAAPAPARPPAPSAAPKPAAPPPSAKPAPAPVPARPAPVPAPAKPAAPAAPPSAAAYAPAGVQIPEDPAHQKAARLARTIIADIALYNPEEVTRGVKEGNLKTLLAKDLEDGRKHYLSKVSPEIQKQVDYFEVAIQGLIDRKKKELGLA